MPSPLLASQLYALSQGSRCTGKEQCHWCGAPCNQTWLHDDPPPIPFHRSNTTAKFPNNHWICTGCWLYRRNRTTINYMGGDYKDGQWIARHPFLITEQACWVIKHPANNVKLYETLLHPPLRFVLCLIEGDAPFVNLLQLAVANDVDEVKADTPLYFTVNNVRHEYTVYELEEGLREGVEGRMPGVHALIRILGHHPLMEKNERGRGRPRKEEEPNFRKNRPVRGSGSV